MRFPIGVLAVLIIVGLAQADDSDKPWQIHGQVIDEQGTPVEDFEAAAWWIANGNWWDERGELLKEAKTGKLWTNEGVLAPSPNLGTKRLPGGRFSHAVDGRPRECVFAVDKRHERGGLVVVEKSESDKPVTITLAPLVRVTAKIQCSDAGKTPDWSCADVYVLDDKDNRMGMMICGSFRGQISLLLPPGKYQLYFNSTSPTASLYTPDGKSAKDAAAGPSQRGMRVEIPPGKVTLDLGVLDLKLPRDKEGVPRDITKYFGKEPPELAITDARGVAKAVKLADFRGKWVLLDFWAVGCSPCVHKSLPKLTKFYEEHAADRDRFEILAICDTEADNVRTIEEYDALVAPVVKKVWAGKPLPFPVLVDGEGRTTAVYGIQSIPKVLLIDPEGRLVKDGDEVMLARKLKEQKP